MQLLWTYIVSGLTTAAIYAIAATGLVLTYTTTGVFNFAHGGVGMMAAFTYWQLRFGWNWPAPVALIVVLFILAPLTGMLLEWLMMRRLDGTSDTTKLVVTLARQPGSGIPPRPDRSASSGTVRWSRCWGCACRGIN